VRGGKLTVFLRKDDTYLEKKHEMIFTSKACTGRRESHMGQIRTKRRDIPTMH
jgi:hypothetical protein